MPIARSAKRKKHKLLCVVLVGTQVLVPPPARRIYGAKTQPDLRAGFKKKYPSREAREKIYTLQYRPDINAIDEILFARSAKRKIH